MGLSTDLYKGTLRLDGKFKIQKNEASKHKTVKTVKREAKQEVDVPSVERKKKKTEEINRKYITCGTVASIFDDLTDKERTGPMACERAEGFSAAQIKNRL